MYWTQQLRQSGDDSAAFPWYRAMQEGREHIAQVRDPDEAGRYCVVHESFPLNDRGDAGVEGTFHYKKAFDALPAALAHLFEYVGHVPDRSREG